MTLFRFVALLVLVNIAALLWPSGEKSAILGPVTQNLTDIDAQAVSLLAEDNEYAQASTGLVLATMRPDGLDGDAIAGPYYMLNEWDDSITQVIDEVDESNKVDEIGESFAIQTASVGSDSSNPSGGPFESSVTDESRDDAPTAQVSDTSNARPKQKFRPLLLGLRPDLSGGHRTGRLVGGQPIPDPDSGDIGSPDGPPLVALNAQRLRAVLTSFTPDPVILKSTSTRPAPRDAGATVLAATTDQSDEADVSTDAIRSDKDRPRKARPTVVGVDSNTVVSTPSPVSSEKIKPADVKPSATVEPQVAIAAPVGPTECVRLGPFFSKEAFEKVSERLASDGLSFRGRSVDARRVKAIRVFLGPFADDGVLETTSEKLRSAGVRDFYVMPVSDAGTTISLGLFSTQDTANNLVDRLTGYDIEVQSREELRQLSPTYWLETDKQGVDSEQRKALNDVPLGDRHARLRKMSCKARG